jgi:DNA-directed RNA polymerase specialized sigma24 family protein
MITVGEIRQQAQSVMTAKQYDAWKLVYWEGRSQRQAARILGIDRSSLLARLEGAWRRMRETSLAENGQA